MTDLLYDLSPTAVAVLMLALVTAALWIVWKALPIYRAYAAVKSAPLVPVAAGAKDLVKVKGTAGAAEVPAGFGTPMFLWREESRTARPGFSSGTYCVAKVLPRDETGECVIHSEEARVVPSDTDVDIDRRIFGEDITTFTRFIRNGDPIFAIGLMGQGKLRRRLRPGPGGALVLSGKGEAQALRHFLIRLVPLAGMALICASFAIGVWWLRPPF